MAMLHGTSGGNIGEPIIQSLSLRSVLGGYELVFALKVSMNPSDIPGCGVFIVGADVDVLLGSERTRCGFARADDARKLWQQKTLSTPWLNLVLSLNPGQIAALEDMRQADDLKLELTLVGHLLEDQKEYYLRETISYREAHSDWIKQLRSANVRDVVLIEVPLPLEIRSERWDTIGVQVRKAEERFRHGDYSGCIASCRVAIEELGQWMYDQDDWGPKSLDQLSSGRKAMSEAERERSVMAAVRHFTHQAHHGEGEGGVTVHTRARAQWVLAVTAGFAALGRAE